MVGWLSKKWDPLSGLPDLTGRVVVVTGGNDGIGFQTISYLVNAGAKVYMGARDESKAREAIDRLRAETPKVAAENIIWLPLELSDLRGVVKAAEIVKSKESRLDILINNAGNVAATYKTTDAGFEMNMAVNYVGHFVFTEALLPLLKSTAAQPGTDVRIVIVTSSVHYSFVPASFPLDFSLEGLRDPMGESKNAKTASTKARESTTTSGSNKSTAEPKDMLPLRLRRYGIAKLANVLFAAELQRRLDAEHPSQCSRILCMSVHPGSVGTDGAMSLFPWPIRALLRVAVFVPPNEGAWPSLFAAAAPEVRENEEKFAGAYMEPPAGSVAKPHVQARGETGVRMARELWQATEEGVSAYLGGNWRAGIGEGH